MRQQLDIELKLLNIFVMVVRSQTMTEAAERLNVTQSAVSQSINHLEERLGTQLIDRTIRPLALTTPGSILFDEAKTILAMMQTITTKVMTSSGRSLPNLRVGMTECFASTIGSQLLYKHLDAAKNWSVKSTGSNAHVQALQDRELDIVITSDVIDQHSNLEAREILKEPLILATPKNYTGSIQNLEILANKLDLIRHSTNTSFGQQIDNHLRRINIQPNNRMEMDGIGSTLAMVNIGAGWTITTPMCLIQAQPSINNITFSPLPAPGLRRSISLVTRRGEHPLLLSLMATTISSVFDKTCGPIIEKYAPWALENLIFKTAKISEDLIPVRAAAAI